MVILKERWKTYLSDLSSNLLLLSAVNRASQIEKGARQHGKSVRLSSKPSFLASDASGIPADRDASDERDATAETSSYLCLLLRLAPELAP